MGIERIKLRAAVRIYLATDPLMIRPESRNTRLGYERSLKALLRVCGSQQTAYELKSEHFDLALLDLRTGAGEEERAMCARNGLTPRRGRSSQSLNSDAIAYRQFVKFLHRREYLSAARNPVAHLKTEKWKPRVTLKEMVVQPSQDVFSRLLEAAGARHPRDRAVVALGAYTGLRESELVALKIENIDFEAGEVRAYRKKIRDWHVVPMHPDLVPELERYLAWLKSKHGALQPGWFLLGSRRMLVGLAASAAGVPSGGLSPESPVDPTKQAWRLSLDVKAAFTNAGYEGLYRSGSHTLRRMAGLYVTDETGDRRNAMRLYGHQAEATTEGYLRWDDGTEKLRQAMAKLKATRLPETAAVGGNVLRFAPRVAVA